MCMQSKPREFQKNHRQSLKEQFYLIIFIPSISHHRLFKPLFHFSREFLKFPEISLRIPGLKNSLRLPGSPGWQTLCILTNLLIKFIIKISNSNVIIYIPLFMFLIFSNQSVLQQSIFLDFCKTRKMQFKAAQIKFFSSKVSFLY